MAITCMPVNQTKCSLRVRKHSCNSYTVLYTPWSNLAAMYGKPDWIKICLYVLSDRALDCITQSPRLWFTG